jgi:hypothetical protein
VAALSAVVGTSDCPTERYQRLSSNSQSIHLPVHSPCILTIHIPLEQSNGSAMRNTDTHTDRQMYNHCIRQSMWLHSATVVCTRLHITLVARRDQEPPGISNSDLCYFVSVRVGDFNNNTNMTLCWSAVCIASGGGASAQCGWARSRSRMMWGEMEDWQVLIGC